MHFDMAILLPSLLFFLLTFTSNSFVSTAAISEGDALLKFKDSLIDKNNALRNWDNNRDKPPCDGDSPNWFGVLCDNGRLWGLKLENMGLEGTIDVDTLKDLPDLRTISFMSNKFGNPMPEVKKLGALKAVFLSGNDFSGEIPADAFEGMLSLKKLYLSDNKFSGEIPSSLTTLGKLYDLKLDHNKFSGSIPEFKQKLTDLDLSNNDLSGAIPASVAKMDSASFAGNKGLCGGPLTACASPAESTLASITGIADSNPTADSVTTLNPNPTNSDSKVGDSKHSKLAIAIIAAVAVAAILAIIILIFAVRKRKEPASSAIEAPAAANLQKRSGNTQDADDSSQQSAQLNGAGAAGKKVEPSMKLTFVRDDREKFDLHDMLKASAELLGSGCFGSSYKAALTSGAAMVVKRFKQMNNVGKEEFQEHMRRLGRLRHPNLLPLVAYYYRKEEKLLVTDFVQKGSLSVHLHGDEGQPGLDWGTRLNIIKGVTNGLQYLYKELPSIIAPHGHIKSSNILLDENLHPFITDYGLIPVINQESAQELMVAYKSPEYLQHNRVTKKTDVWGLGILILEILTGKLPANFVRKTGTKNKKKENNENKANEEEDLVSWVETTFNGEWTNEVFDKDMGSVEKSSQEEMVKLLKIGLSCCEADVEKRMDIKEVVEKIDELKVENDNGNDNDNDNDNSNAE